MALQASERDNCTISRYSFQGGSYRRGQKQSQDGLKCVALNSAWCLMLIKSTICTQDHQMKTTTTECSTVGITRLSISSLKSHKIR